jgi:hypothetical protein
MPWYVIGSGLVVCSAARTASSSSGLIAVVFCFFLPMGRILPPLVCDTIHTHPTSGLYFGKMNVHPVNGWQVFAVDLVKATNP